MNRNLWLLALCQGLFLTNNVTFIAINGLVGLRLAPHGWMATLPIMGYVVGGALATGLVARTQQQWGRRVSFQVGLGVAVVSALACGHAAYHGDFWLLVAATIIAGYYNANANLYRFAAAELAEPQWQEKAVSLVMAGGLIGAIAGPNLASSTRDLMGVPFAGAYLMLALVAVLAMVLMQFIDFPPPPPRQKTTSGRAMGQIIRQPVFWVAALCGALSYGVMNLLMAATPIAMQQVDLPFDKVAHVLALHVFGMFAPGFFTGHLIRRFGSVAVMGAGLVLYFVCILVALSGVGLGAFFVALFLLGVGWNFVFTGSTTLSLTAYTDEEKDRAQGVLNFSVFGVMAVSSLTSGQVVGAGGWEKLNYGSLVPVAVMAVALIWLTVQERRRGLVAASA